MWFGTVAVAVVRKGTQPDHEHGDHHSQRQLQAGGQGAPTEEEPALIESRGLSGDLRQGSRSHGLDLGGHAEAETFPGGGFWETPGEEEVFVDGVD